MIIHILNDDRSTACGRERLPKGDRFFYASEIGNHHYVTCEGCKPHRVRLGTPLSELSVQPGTRGFDRFSEIASTWGFE